MLFFLKARDDNLLLLISGLIAQIQENQKVWNQNRMIGDLFGFGKQIKIGKKHEVLGDLIKVLAMKPQYFRSITLINSVLVLNQFYE